MNNDTYFEASNGWQFQVNGEGHMEYRFMDQEKWYHLSTQLGLGIIEWAQSDIWQEETE